MEVLENNDLNVVLGKVGTNPKFLALDESDKQAVLRDMTDRFILANGLEGEDELRAKETSNTFNELTSVNRDRVRPTQDFLSDVFEGYDPNGSKQQRLDQIEGFRAKARKSAVTADYLNANDIAYTTELLLDSEERSVRGEDSGWLADGAARVAEEFVAPLGNFAHIPFQSAEERSEGERKFRVRSFAENVEFDDNDETFKIHGIRLNPNEHISFGQKLAGGAGSLGSGLTVAVGSSLAGLAISGGNPYVAGAFGIAGSGAFNSNLRFQEGFTAEFQASGDHELAVEAGFAAMPAAAIDTVADRFLVGKLGLGKFNRQIKAAKTAERKAEILNKALKLRRTKDIVSGFAFEGGTELLGDVVSVHRQIAATGRQELRRTPKENLDIFLIGGILGAGVSGAGSVRTSRVLNQMNQDLNSFTTLLESDPAQAKEFGEKTGITQRFGLELPDVDTQQQTQQNDGTQNEAKSNEGGESSPEDASKQPQDEGSEGSESSEAGVNQPINGSPEAEVTFETDTEGNINGSDGSRVTRNNLIRIEDGKLVVRGPRGAVRRTRNLPPEASPEVIQAAIDAEVDAIRKASPPPPRVTKPENILSRSNKRLEAERSDLQNSNAELGAAVDNDTTATEDGSKGGNALAAVVSATRKSVSGARKHKARTSAEKPAFDLLGTIAPGISALARSNPLAAQRLGQIAENMRRSRRKSQEGAEFREQSEAQAAELAELNNLAREAYIAEKQAKFGKDFPEAFADPSQSINGLNLALAEAREKAAENGEQTRTPSDWEQLFEVHRQNLPPADEILPEGLSEENRALYDQAIEAIQALDTADMTPTQIRDAFMSLDSIVTDRSPSQIFEALKQEQARQRAEAIGRGKGLFRFVGGKFRRGARGTENILKALTPSERGRAILRNVTQPWEDAENNFLRQKADFTNFAEALFNRTIGPLMGRRGAQPLASVRVGIVSDIVQGIDGEVNQSVRNTIEKLRASLTRQIRPIRGAVERTVNSRENAQTRHAQRTLNQLNDFLEGIDLDSDTLFQDVSTRADTWLTAPEAEYLTGMRNWFSSRRADVQFLTEAVIGRPFQGITNYMPQMLLADNPSAIETDLDIESTNMDSVAGAGANRHLTAQERANLRLRTQTNTVPDGHSYILDAVYKYTMAAHAMLYDLNTLAERRITNSLFNGDNRVAIEDSMGGRAENVKALEENFKIRAGDQLEAHRGTNLFSEVMGWGYRRLSGRALSGVHQLFSQFASPMSHFVALNSGYTAILPQALAMGMRSRINQGTVESDHVARHIPTLHDRNFVGERNIKEQIANRVPPATRFGQAWQSINGFLDGINERVLYKGMQWGDMLSANGLYFANLYRVMHQRGAVQTFTEFQENLHEATDADVRQAKINTEQNIAPSANNQRGYLAATRGSGITALRMMLIPFTSHRLNAISEFSVASRDLFGNGHGRTRADKMRAARIMAATGVQSAVFTSVKFGIGAALYLAVKGLMDFEEEEDEVFEQALFDLEQAKEERDDAPRDSQEKEEAKAKVRLAEAEVRAIRNVRKIIKNKDKKKLSGESLAHQVFKDIVGNTLYVATPDETTNFAGMVVDQMRREDFKALKEQEVANIKKLIEDEKDTREKARLKRRQADIEGLEMLEAGHRPFGAFDSTGTFGSVVDPASTALLEGVDTVFDDTNEFSFNDLLLGLGVFGVGQADLTSTTKFLEKIQEEKHKLGVEETEKEEKRIQKEIDAESKKDDD